MSFPTFSKDSKKKLSEEKKKEAEELGVVPCIYLTVTFLLYALASIAAFVIVVTICRTLLLVVEVALALVGMIGLGIGPFTYEFMRKKSGFSKCILLILLPLTVFVGIFKSFKVIFRRFLNRILHLYKLDLTLKIREIIDPIINFD